MYEALYKHTGFPFTFLLFSRLTVNVGSSIVWNAHNTVFGSNRLHKLFTSCIRRGLVSGDSIVDVDWLPATE